MMMAGIPLPLAVMITIPEPWETARQFQTQEEISINTTQQ